MHVGWQDVLVIATIALAALFLLRQAWLVLARKKAGGCGGGCSSCPSEQNKAGLPVVQLAAPRKPSGDRADR